MTDQEKEEILARLHRKLTADSVEASTPMELKMLQMEHQKNVELVNQGINVFAERPDNSPYNCEGCGS
jgi:wyosine [tRNA(Phe)-imidazoG37] synthetase (radical SAM superfamily)